MEKELISSKIKMKMKKEGISYEKLGCLIGMSKGNLYNMIKRSTFRYSKLKNICDALGLVIKIE